MLRFFWHFSEDARHHEALDIATVINSVVTYCPMSVIVQLPTDTVADFLSFLSRVSCEFCRASTDESVRLLFVFVTFVVTADKLNCVQVLRNF